MTPEQIETFKQAIDEAVQSHLAGGNRVISGSFTMYGENYCPVTCLTGPDEKNIGYSTLLSKKLGYSVTSGDMFSFVDGFDGALYCSSIDRTLFDIGRQMREKYINKVVQAY